MKKYLPFILSVLGVLIFCFLTVKTGIYPILNTLSKIGIEGFILLIIAQFLVNLLLSLAWKGSVPDISFIRLASARFIRDAASACLPFSQLGGMLIGIRATSIGHYKNHINQAPSASVSLAANIVDITTEILGQIAFITLTLLYLTQKPAAGQYIWPLSMGMVLLSAAISAFIWTQQRSNLIFNKILTLISKYFSSQNSELFKNQSNLFQANLTELWSHPFHIACGAALHLIAWFSSAAITWLSLYLLHISIDFFDSIAIEGVVCGIISAGFFIPGSLGVQEGAYIAIGLLFGIPQEVSLCLSLLRRGRDIIIGIPTLLLWQFFEFRFLKEKHKQPL